MRRQQEQMRQQQQMQQQQRILQQQRARQASEQARAAQQKAIRDQDKRRQFSQRQNMTQKLQQQKAMEQNNRASTQRRLTQERLVQQKKLQKNRQEREQKNRDIGVLALIGSAPEISMSPQLSERIRNVTRKPANDNNPIKVTAGNTGNINRPSGKKTGSGGGDSGRPSFKLTKVFNQNAKPLSKDIALRLMTLDAAKKRAGSIIRDKQKMKDRLFLIKKNKEERRLANLRKAEKERLDKEKNSISNNSGKLYHYTSSKYVDSILKNGLKPGASGKVFTTPDKTKSGLQAQIDLSLPPNRGTPDAVIEIDMKILKQMGIKIPDTSLVKRDFNMPGGGQEVIFDTLIPPEAIRRIK